MLRPDTPTDSRLGYLSWYAEPQLIGDALIVIDQRVLDGYERRHELGSSFREGEVPSYCYDPPENWTLLEEAHGMRVYRTNRS